MDVIYNGGAYGADAESQCGEAMDACVMRVSRCDQMQDERSSLELLRGTHGQRREREPVPGVHVARLYDYCV